jgi:DNA-directed RNA polymerase specialized sigma24 family protein
MNEDDSNPAENNGAFPLTRWTRVGRLRGDPESTEGRRALEELCSAYWYPLYVFARRKGQSQEDAQDLAQGFFVKILKGDFLAGADQSQGRMRTYLLTAFTRFMADEWDKAKAIKRGGKVEMLSLDFEDGERRFIEEPAAVQDHERAYERDWALSVIELSGAQLEKECSQSGKAALFAALSPLITGAGEVTSYESLTQSTGMSVEAMRQTVRRLRLRFKEILRQVIADTLENPTEAQVDVELRSLRAALADG